MILEQNFLDSGKRDPLLSYGVYHEQSVFFNEDRQESYDIINDQAKELTHRTGVSWSCALDKFESAKLEYSAGNELAYCEKLMHEALSELERHKDQFQDENYLYWEPDSMQFLFWAMSFAVLSGKPDSLETIARMVGKNPLDVDDPILSILLTKVGYIGLPRGTDLCFPKSYQHLYDAVKGDGVNPTKEQRQASLKKYLSSWYKGMKGCYWYGRHKARVANFTGYWSFEAALVTLLYDLEDSSYSHMLYYPKDLVAHARKKGYDKAFEEGKVNKHYIALPNDEASLAGTWLCNLTDEKITLAHQERLPRKKKTKKNKLSSG